MQQSCRRHVLFIENNEVLKYIIAQNIRIFFSYEIPYRLHC